MSGGVKPKSAFAKQHINMKNTPPKNGGYTELQALMMQSSSNHVSEQAFVFLSGLGYHPRQPTLSWWPWPCQRKRTSQGRKYYSSCVSLYLIPIKPNPGGNVTKSTDDANSCSTAVNCIPCPINLEP